MVKRKKTGTEVDTSLSCKKKLHKGQVNASDENLQLRENVSQINYISQQNESPTTNTNKRKGRSKIPSTDDKVQLNVKNRKRKTADSTFDRKKMYQSPSNKFENQVPKINDLVRDMQLQEKLSCIDKVLLAQTRIFNNGLTKKKNNKNIRKKRIRILDCKHLTLKDLTVKFKKDVQFLDNIFYGKVYNERHESFKTWTQEEAAAENDLRCNYVNPAFSQEQLIHIVTLFRNRYDNGNRYTWSDYYFKVLLPEYCLKIFMDCHGMDQEKTLEYLKSLPLQVEIN